MSKKKTTGFVAGAAGIALLMGGATFALWNDSADAGGGTITAGNLQVEVDDPIWKDISLDSENPGVINLTDFRIVPGDTIEGRFPMGLALEGNNLRAELSLVGEDNLKSELLDKLDVSYTVKDQNENQVASGSQLPVSVMLTSEHVPSKFDEPNFYVDVKFYFDRYTPERELVQTQAELQDIGLKLSQVRD